MLVHYFMRERCGRTHRGAGLAAVPMTCTDADQLCRNVRLRVERRRYPCGLDQRPDVLDPACEAGTLRRQVVVRPGVRVREGILKSTRRSLDEA